MIDEPASRWNTNAYSDYCITDGCYRPTTGSTQRCVNCARTHHRGGRINRYTKGHDWVRDKGGSACQICGRLLMEHAIGEFCELAARAS